MWIWSLAIFIVIGFFLRFMALFSSITYDEAYTFLTYSSKPLMVAIGMYNLPNNHLLNSFLVWLMNHLVGGEPWWIRLPNLFAWALTVYQLYHFLRKKFSLELALLVLAALSISLQFVSYAALARGYMLNLCLILNVWFLLGKDLEGESHPILLPLLMALSFWSLPTSLYPISAFFVYWVWQRSSELKKIFQIGFRGALITFFFYSPALIYVMLNGSKRVTDDLVINSIGGFGSYLWDMIKYLSESQFAFTGVAFGLLFLLFPILFWNKDRGQVKLWICLLCVPWILIFVSGVVPPFYRVWLWMGPFFFIFAFRSLQELLLRLRSSDAWVSTLVTMVLLLPMAVNSGTVHYKKWLERSFGPSQVSQALKRTVAPGDLLAFYGGYLEQLEYWAYLNRDNENFLPMKRYPVGGNFKFSLDRLHAEPSVLRKDPRQLREFKVWAFLDENGLSAQLNTVIEKEFPGWRIHKLEESTIALGEQKVAAFMVVAPQQ